MAHIKLQTPEELEAEFKALVEEVTKMRVYQMYWHEHFGHDAKEKKKRWEARVDNRLRQLGIDDIDHFKNTRVVKQ